MGATLVVIKMLVVWYVGVAPLLRSWGEAARRAESMRTLAVRRATVLRELQTTPTVGKNEEDHTSGPTRGAEPLGATESPIDAIYSAAAESGFEVQELTYDSSCAVRDQRITEAYRLVGYGAFQSVARFSRGIAEARPRLALAKLRITPRNTLGIRLELDVAACVAFVSEL